jgi:hypothetical protein
MLPFPTERLPQRILAVQLLDETKKKFITTEDFTLQVFISKKKIKHSRI